jgi:hypothetical protein
MAKEKKEKQARLSAYGLASFVKVVDTVDYDFYISEKDKKVKLKVYINPHTQRKGVIYLKSNYTRENIQHYINDLYTIFNKIPIKDKDKVFFSKNSKYLSDPTIDLFSNTSFLKVNRNKLRRSFGFLKFRNYNETVTYEFGWTAVQRDAEIL